MWGGEKKAFHFQPEDLHSTRQSEDITDPIPPLAMQEELKHNHVWHHSSCTLMGYSSFHLCYSKKHSTFQSLDLLNGFTCPTLWITKKRRQKKKALAQKSLALVWFLQVMYYFLLLTKTKPTLKKVSLHWGGKPYICIYVSCFCSCSKLIAKFDYLHNLTSEKSCLHQACAVPYYL